MSARPDPLEALFARQQQAEEESSAPRRGASKSKPPSTKARSGRDRRASSSPGSAKKTAPGEDEDPTAPRRPERRARPEPVRFESAAAALKAIQLHAGRLISMKEWSRKTLQDRLALRFKGTFDEVDTLCSQVADRMAEIGAIDDARFARGFIRARLSKKSLSQIQRALSESGVDPDAQRQALDELREEGLIEDPFDQALSVWRRKFGQAPSDERERGKQARFLASRGFAFSHISKIFDLARRGEI